MNVGVSRGHECDREFKLMVMPLQPSVLYICFDKINDFGSSRLSRLSL